jgi:hypothetical protein
MKSGSKETVKIVSLDPVRRGDWVFKVSSYDEIILVHSFNAELHWSNIRFFDSEIMAHNFIEYLMLQSEMGTK